jgi:FRG domain
MTWPEITIKSWKQFNDEVLEKHLMVTHYLRRGYIYRGQADVKWSLQPSLTRLCHLLAFDKARSLDVERRILQRFAERAHLHLPSHVIPRGGLVNWWTVMQHYSAPTRILDWTHSPLVALYFAVNTKWTTDGAVWIVHIGSLVKYSNQRYGEIKDWELEDEGIEDQTDTLFRSENPPPRIISFDRTLLTDRMAAQQGTFTICQDLLIDHAHAIAEVLPAPEPKGSGEAPIYRVKVIIPMTLKQEFLKRLHLMNITASALFPGIDGLGREIEELIRIAGP